MRMPGTVEDVRIEAAGGYTVGVTSAGASVLQLNLAVDFGETGGLALIGDVQARYTSADLDAQTVTLETPLADDVPDRTMVYAVFTDPDGVVQKAVEKLAQVRPTAWPDGDTLECVVPSGQLWADTRLAEGSRGGQLVMIEHRRRGLWEVVDILGTPPSLDGRHISPMTLQPASFNQAAFAADGTISAIVNASDTTTYPLLNTRIRNGAGMFNVRTDGTGEWDGLDTVPPIIAAAIAAGGGGGGGTGGVDIDCGTATASGVDIDCGVA